MFYVYKVKLRVWAVHAGTFLTRRIVLELFLIQQEALLKNALQSRTIVISVTSFRSKYKKGLAGPNIASLIKTYLFIFKVLVNNNKLNRLFTTIVIYELMTLSLVVVVFVYIAVLKKPTTTLTVLTVNPHYRLVLRLPAFQALTYFWL